MPTAEVRAFAAANGATAYDIPDVTYTHVGAECSFDAFIRTTRSPTRARRLATIVRGADTAALDLAAQAPGLLSVSLGLSRDVRRRPRDAALGHARLRRALRLVPRSAAARRTAGIRQRCATGSDVIDGAADVRRRADARRGASLLVPPGLHQFRRPGGTDRAHASRTGRREALDLRTAASCTRSTTAWCCPGRRRSSSRRTSAG